MIRYYVVSANSSLKPAFLWPRFVTVSKDRTRMMLHCFEAGTSSPFAVTEIER